MYIFYVIILPESNDMMLFYENLVKDMLWAVHGYPSYPMQPFSNKDYTAYNIQYIHEHDIKQPIRHHSPELLH